MQVIPCKLEALVGQKAQGELQTREQEEVAEINQTQDLERLHSCKKQIKKHRPTFIQDNKVNLCFRNGSDGSELGPAEAELTVS